MCTEVMSQSSNLIYMVIPLSYRHASDCTCPVLILPNEQCFSFELCHCAADTFFINSLDICYNDVRNFQVCFSSNLQEETNNTVMHFYELPPLSDCYTDQVYRKYIKAMQIVIINGKK